MPGFAPLRRLPLLLLLLALLAAHSSADEAPCRSLLAYVQPCASLPAFAAPVDTTQLACAASAVTDPASAQSFTLAWAIAPLLQKDHMLLGVQLDEGTSWAAVAFPQYAYPQEAPQLAGATALLFERPAAPPVAAADGRAGVPPARPPADGLTVSQWTVPGDKWAGLQPSTRLSYTVESTGEMPGGGGTFATLKLPNFQMQLPSYGSHWPIRLWPTLFALGANHSSSSVVVVGGGSGGGDVPPSRPAAAGTLTIPVGGDVQDFVWWNATSGGAPATQRPAVALAAAALLVGLLCATAL